MRHNDPTIGRRWGENAVGGVLILLALAAGFLPNGRAEIINSGARVQSHRSRDAAPGSASRYQRPPSSSSSYPNTGLSSPDNDFHYQPSYAGGEFVGPASPPVKPTYGVAASALPWNQMGFEGYDEPLGIPRDSVILSGWKYALEATPLPRGTPGAAPQAALLIVRLPEHAKVWVDGILTRSEGATRYFHSPPLPPGRKYNYTLRTAWIEDGRWVSQTQKIPIEAGLIQAIYLRPSPALMAKKKLEAQIEAGLAKLSPEDQDVARRQKVCVIRSEVRLGENGAPVKVMLKNHRVFVCDEGCVKKALADPEGVWNKASALRAKANADPTEK